MHPSPFPTGRPPDIPADALPRGRAVQARDDLTALVGSRVKALRQASGITCDALARLSGKSSSMLSRLERGLVRPSITTLASLAAALGVPLSALLDDQPEFWVWWAARPTCLRRASSV